MLGLGRDASRTSRRPPLPARAISSTACPPRTPTTRPTSAAAPKPASPRCPRRSGSPNEVAAPSSCASPPRSPARSKGWSIPSGCSAIAEDPRTDGAEDIVLCDTLGQAGTRARSPTLSARSDREHRSAASCFTATTRGDWAWPTPSPRSTPAPPWSTVRSAASAAARSLPAPAATPPPKICCSRPGPTWFTPDMLASVVELSENMLADIGEPNRSKTAQGARSATAFHWVIGQDPGGTECARFLVTYPLPEPGMTLLRAAGRSMSPSSRSTPSDLAAALQLRRIRCRGRTTGRSLRRRPACRGQVTGITNYAVGYDNIDVVAATATDRGG